LLTPMKVIRVPWIRCRADEVGAVDCTLEWRGKSCTVLAYSEREAREWWKDLTDGQRDELLGFDHESSEQSSLF
jgi:hypothetical protein